MAISSRTPLDIARDTLKGSATGEEALQVRKADYYVQYRPVDRLELRAEIARLRVAAGELDQNTRTYSGRRAIGINW